MDSYDKVAKIVEPKRAKLKVRAHGPATLALTLARLLHVAKLRRGPGRNLTIA